METCWGGVRRNGRTYVGVYEIQKNTWTVIEENDIDIGSNVFLN